MMSKKRMVVVLVLMLFLPLIVDAQDNVVSVYLFYGQGCPHCGRAEAFFENIQKDHPNLNVISKEVYFNDENRLLFEKFSKAFNSEIEGVPTIFIDKKRFVGFSTDLGAQIGMEIQRCSKELCEDLKRLEGETNNSNSTDINGDSYQHMSSEIYSYVGWAFLGVFGAILIMFIFNKIFRR